MTSTGYHNIVEKLRTPAELPDESYIGMELDGERNQYHFNARSYDAGLSRFFAPDLLWEYDSNVSPYAYCNNNPINSKDPSGLKEESPIEPMPLVEKHELDAGSSDTKDEQIKQIRTFGDGGGDNGQSGSVGTTHVVTSSAGRVQQGGTPTGTGSGRGNAPADKTLTRKKTKKKGKTSSGSNQNNKKTNETPKIVAWSYEKNVLTYLDNLKSSLAYAGNTRIGSNFKLYLPTRTGRAYNGGKTVKTYSLVKISTQGKVFCIGASLLASTYSVYLANEKDGFTYGYNFKVAITSEIFSLAGGVYGATLFGKEGAIWGGILTGGNPAGIAAGGLLGGLGGGLLGGFVGEEIGESVGGFIFDK